MYQVCVEHDAEYASVSQSFLYVQYMTVGFVIFHVSEEMSKGVERNS